MTVDFSKFPYPIIENPHAGSLTEAIAAEPNSAGYAVATIKTAHGDDLAETVRTFAQTLRKDAEDTGFTDITAYREIRPDEMGGAVPFDLAICTTMLADAKQRQVNSKWPALEWAIKMMERNDFADWTLLVEFKEPSQASAAVSAWNRGDAAFSALTQNSTSFTVGAFKNTMRYSRVSRDPTAIQFFNFFPGPGDVGVLWTAWQEALPWFLEVGEFRSSFPLVALDPDQPLLVLNYAHVDSLKHYFLGVAYDPNFFETVTRCYADRGFKLPAPFFCKIVPV